MIFDMEIVGISVLILSHIFEIELSVQAILGYLFPFIFSTWWYMLMYLMIYTIHPLLNLIINAISQRIHLALSVALFTMYFIINTIFAHEFFVNNFIIMLSIYFIVAYLKRYLSNICKNKKINITLLVVSIILSVIFEFVINYIGLQGNRIYYIEGVATRNQTMSSPLLLIACLSLVNIFNNIKIYSKIINYLSSCSLLIYIVHGNDVAHWIYIKTWKWIYDTLGYDYIITLSLLLTLLIMSVILLISIMYKSTFQKIVYKFSDTIYRKCVLLFYKFTDRLMEIK